MSKDTIHLFNNLAVKGLVANGFVGSSGQALLSNGTGVYWGSGAGFTGSKGDKGADGVFGGAAFDYTFSTATTLADPGDGVLKLNNTVFNDATTLIIHDNDDNGVSVYNFLQTIDDSTSAIKGHFTVTEKANTTNFAQFSIVGNHVDAANSFQIPVAYLTGATSMTNGLDIIITFARTGDKGDTGFTGSFGYTGSQGDIGYTGSRGATGFVGSQGFTGSQGDIGYTGSQGVIGFTGSAGFVGSASTVAGPLGYTGSQGIGYTGSQGTTGYVGSASTEAGPIGYTGSAGAGYTGSQGVIGYTGSKGDIGYTGSKGDIGYTGSKGDIGYTGSQGDGGPQGLIGYTGSKGDIGYTGSAGPIGGSNTQVIFNDSGVANGSSSFVFDKTTGNVGIGTSSPGVKLDVSAGIRGQALDATGTPVLFTTAGGAVLSYSGAGVGVLRAYSNGSGAAGALTFNASGSENMRIDASGNVGIGTSSPGALLDVNGVGRFGSLSSKISVGLNGDSISMNGDLYIQTSTANPLILRTNTTERMRIAAAGEVTAYVDIRAPIFYDSNDTAYYADPNSTSRFKRLVLDNGDNLSWGAAYGAGVPTIAATTNTALYFYPTGSTAGAAFQMYGSYAIASGSMRAPLFYDSDDTTFYTDPAASNSVLNGMFVNRYFQRASGIPTNNLGDPTVTEMALFEEQFNNKTAFFPVANVIFETSTDGTTWTLYSVTDAVKKEFVGGTSGAGVNIPYNTPYFRVRFVNDGNYTFLNALYSYWSAQGHTTKVQIYKKDFGSSTWVQHTSSNEQVSSWPGHLYLPFSTIAYHPGTYVDQVAIVFQPTWNATYSANSIALYKMQIWGGYPAGKRTIYDVDGDKNAIFPAQVRGTSFYDTDNTNRYINPAATSVVNTIEAYGGSGFRSFATPGSGINSQIYFGNADNTRAWNWQLDENNRAALLGYNGTAWAKTLSVATGYAGLFIRNSSGTDVLAFSASTFGYSSAYRTLIIGDQAYTTVCIGVDPVANPSPSFSGSGSGAEVMFKNGVNFITPNAANNSYHTPLTLADGYAASAGSLRAPIFYDSNNTAFFFDGDGSTNINTLTGNGKTAIETADGYLRINQGNAFGNGIWTGSSNFLNSGGIFGWGSNGGTTTSRVYINGGTYNGTNVIAIDGTSGTIWTRGQIQSNEGVSSTTNNAGSAVFRSSFAGTGQYRHSIVTRHNSSANTDNAWDFYLWRPEVAAGTEATHRAFVIDGAAGTTSTIASRAPIFYDSNNTACYVDPESGSVLGGQVLFAGGTKVATNGDVYARREAGTTGVYYFADGGSKYLYHDGANYNFGSAGVVLTPTSFRGPVFYDSDNTAYYFDGATTGVSLTAAGTLESSGGIGVAGAGATNDPYGRISVTRPNDANYSYYGLTRQGSLGMGMGIDTSNLFWVGSTGAGYNGTRTSIYFQTNTSGDVTAAGSLRAPVFYDSNDTAYWINPNNSQSIRTVGDWRSDSGEWTGEFSGKIQYHANNWYFQSASEWMFRRSDGGTAFRVEQSGFGTFLSSIRVGSGGTSSDIYMGDSDHGERRLHCNSDRIGFLTQGEGWGSYCSDNGDWTTEYIGYALASSRSPIFYDYNNTAYAFDGDGTSRWNISSQDSNHVFNQCGVGIVGSYDSTKFQTVFAMGSAYISNAAGTSITGAYGLWWSHPNAGGQAAGLDSHGLLSVINGVTSAQLGRITSAVASMRAPIFYDLDNTGYYSDPASTSNFLDMYIQGGVGGTSNSASYLYAAIELRERGFGGAQDDTWATAPRIAFHWGGRVASQIAMSSNGRIAIRNNPCDNYEAFECGNFYAPIFYDSNDTAYSVDPTGTSRTGLIRADYYGRAAHNTGFLRGGYNNIGASEGQTSPIYCIGSSYEPGTTTLGIMYGIGFTSGGSFFPSGASGWGMYTADNGVSRIFLSAASGDITATGNITAYASDRRLKTNIKPISNAIDKLMRINGVEFDWVDNIQEIGFIPQTMHETGVIAQEIQAVIPDAVKIAPFNKNATDISGIDNEYLTVDKEKIIPLLIEAIKEQQARINRLEETVNNLMGNK